MKSAPRRVITKTNIHSESYRLTEKTIMSLKLGVIGAGAIGKEHIRRCTQVLQGATVVAVSDINADNARAAVALPGVQAEVYADGHDVINASDVDAILVTSWDPTHEEYTLAAIAAGPVSLPSPRGWFSWPSFSSSVIFAISASTKAVSAGVA